MRKDMLSEQLSEKNVLETGGTRSCGRKGPASWICMFRIFGVSLIVSGIFCCFKIRPVEGQTIKPHFTCKTVWRGFPARAKALFERYHSAVQKNGVEVDIDGIDLETSKELVSIDNPFVKKGTLSGQEVFLKPALKFENNKKELAVYLTLRDLGVPVLFKGVLEDDEGDLYMVSQFREGVVSQLPFRPMNIANTPYQELNEWRELFLKYHIIPRSFQFLVCGNTAHLIDVKTYEFAGETSVFLREKERCRFWKYIGQPFPEQPE